ncbi:MAG: type I secretion system permease/ATPase [Pseudomonadota bacterium]
MDHLLDHLSALTRLLGHPVSAQALAAQTTRNAAGRLDFHSLAEVLRVHGFDNKLDERGLDQLPELAVPFLLIMLDGSGRVVEAVRSLSDPLTGQTRRVFVIRALDGERTEWDEAALAEDYSGYVWFLKARPQKDLRSDLPEYTMGRAWFWRVIWRFRRYYVQVVLATVLINVLSLVGSLYVMNVYDRVVPNKAYETLWALSIGVVLANLFEFAARMVRSRLTDIAGKKADLIISTALFRRMMAMDLADKPASAGSYANNLRDFESVREFMTSASLLALVDLPFLLLFIAVIYVIAGPLAWVPLVSVPLVVGAGLLAQAPLARYAQESMKEGSQRQGLAVEAIEGIETIKANNAANWAQQRWDHFTAVTAAAGMKLRDVSNLVMGFAQWVQQLNTVALVVWGTYLVHSDNVAQRITMGALIASVILSGRALSPLSSVAALLVRFQQARVALRGLDAMVQRRTERDVERSYVSLSRIPGQIEFRQVGFRYGQGAPVLNDVNLVIRPGEKVAILGRIGSGKSTLLRLAAGLYAPAQGNVLLDDVDMRQIDPADLRSQVSLLGQSPRLFFGTLRDNLQLGRMDRFSADDELIAALRRFGLDRVVQQHPMGLDLPIGEDGHGLSGGQKQIVSLVRLTLRDPKVVLLDEPTSGLDEMTEVAALRALAEWGQSRTMVVVTHRPSVLPFVQRVIVVDQGRIVMDGPRDQVLQRLRGGPAAHASSGEAAAPAAPRPPAPSAPAPAAAAGATGAAGGPGTPAATAPSPPPAAGPRVTVVNIDRHGATPPQRKP